MSRLVLLLFLSLQTFLPVQALVAAGVAAHLADKAVRAVVFSLSGRLGAGIINQAFYS